MLGGFAQTAETVPGATPQVVTVGARFREELQPPLCHVCRVSCGHLFFAFRPRLPARVTNTEHDVYPSKEEGFVSSGNFFGTAVHTAVEGLKS